MGITKPNTSNISRGSGTDYVFYKDNCNVRDIKYKQIFPDHYPLCVTVHMSNNKQKGTEKI